MKKIFIVGLIVISLLSGCNKEHFITDNAYRQSVEQDFEARKELLKETQIFSIFENDISLKELEAMKFLYAYSPLTDITLFDGTFWLENVKQTFKVKEEMPWGKTIPEDVFRHFVLPIRANNEDLDSSRIAFYKELAPRIQECNSMEEAALEINHWCHEKVNYQPTDARTASPMAVIKRTYGRCGEESVFAIAALRSMGIPARQIYTPRWAHCDDNHAWVEVWIDGEWKFIGACEPEPALNMAWFTFPASRGLFMQAKVFGKYNGSEEIVSKENLITLVNSTSTYTDTNKPIIKVLDNSNNPVPNAIVDYKIYNYSEYNTVASLVANEKGEASLTIGQGDWLIWGSSKEDNSFGFTKINPKGLDTIIIKLDYNINNCSTIDTIFNIIPPAGKDFSIIVSETQRKINDIRMRTEDSIRNAYAKTFITKDKSYAFGKENGYNQNQCDTLWTYLKSSMGNYLEITNFIKSAKDKAKALILLGAINTKDIQDIKSSILLSHLSDWENNLIHNNDYSPHFMAQYVISPRIKTERITAWRAPIKEWLTKVGASDINILIDAMSNIKADKNTTHANIYMTPECVAKSGICDPTSKEIFFVAACRTIGIPARLNPINGKPQYYYKNDWITVNLDADNKEENINKSGYLVIKCNDGVIADPLYYINFTTSKIEKGRTKLMELGDSAEGDMGPGMKCSSIFKRPVKLEEGTYLLTTGNRKADGSVISEAKFFTIDNNKTTNLQLKIHPAKEESNIIGHIDIKNSGIDFPKKAKKYILIFLSNNEPSNHLTRDIESISGELDNNKECSMLLFFQSKEAYDAFKSNGRRMPKSTIYIVDNNKDILNNIANNLNLENIDNLPLVTILYNNENVFYISQGYKIGTGYQIMKYL